MIDVNFYEKYREEKETKITEGELLFYIFGSLSAVMTGLLAWIMRLPSAL